MRPKLKKTHCSASVSNFSDKQSTFEAAGLCLSAKDDFKPLLVSCITMISPLTNVFGKTEQQDCTVDRSLSNEILTGALNLLHFNISLRHLHKIVNLQKMIIFEPIKAMFNQ